MPVAVVGALAVGGCSASVSVGSLSVSKAKVASQISDKLLALKGQRPPASGATERCMITADDGSTLGVTVTVNTVKGKTVNFDIQVDETVTPAPTSS